MLNDLVRSDQHRCARCDEDIDDDYNDNGRQHSAGPVFWGGIDFIVIIGQELESLIGHEHRRRTK